jgi:hypothetical protein
MRVSGQLHDLAVLPPGKSPGYLLDRIDRRLGGAQGLSVRGDEEKNLCLCRESNL